MNKNTEYIDIVDENNNMIGVGERDSVHRDRLMHRAVHIFVFNSAGELFVQKRAAIKKEHPGKLDSSAAGHVDAGEGCDDSARRELKEELSIDVPLKRVMEIGACSETDNEFVTFYTATCDRKIKIDPNEIEDGFFLNINTIRKMVEIDKNAFTPAFLLIFDCYLQERN